MHCQCQEGDDTGGWLMDTFTFMFTFTLIFTFMFSITNARKALTREVVDGHFVPNHPENDFLDKGHQPCQKTNITGRKEGEIYPQKINKYPIKFV